MKVHELARKTGETPHVVRYYARIGLLRPARDPDNGYRRFDNEDLLRLRFIRQARSLGFTLAEIGGILAEADHGTSPCPRVREIIERRIDENRRHIDELLRLQQRMEAALAHWDAMPDGLPDGHSVCHLIESAEGIAAD